jgi:hypothetical protein
MINNSNSNLASSPKTVFVPDGHVAVPKSDEMNIAVLPRIHSSASNNTDATTQARASNANNLGENDVIISGNKPSNASSTAPIVILEDSGKTDTVTIQNEKKTITNGATNTPIVIDEKERPKRKSNLAAKVVTSEEKNEKTLAKATATKKEEQKKKIQREDKEATKKEGKNEKEAMEVEKGVKKTGDKLKDTEKASETKKRSINSEESMIDTSGMSSRCNFFL